MKKIVLALMLSVAFCVSSSLAGEQDFTVVNETGVEIHELYVSSAASAEWEEDILGQDTLPDEESVDISFSPEEDADLWDVKIVDSQGNAIVWERLNLKEISKVTLRYDDQKPTAEVETVEAEEAPAEAE